VKSWVKSPMGPYPALPYPGWGEHTVTVPADYFEEGQLPGICVVTGAPATSNLRRRLSTTPGWVGCLFFISWLALLVAAVATRRSSSGYLPVCNAVAIRVRHRHACRDPAYRRGCPCLDQRHSGCRNSRVGARGEPRGSRPGGCGPCRASRLGCGKHPGSSRAWHPGTCGGRRLRRPLGAAAWRSSSLLSGAGRKARPLTAAPRARSLRT
jgi:hypothetical protein